MYNTHSIIITINDNKETQSFPRCFFISIIEGAVRQSEATRQSPFIKNLYACHLKPDIKSSKKMRIIGKYDQKTEPRNHSKIESLESCGFR